MLVAKFGKMLHLAGSFQAQITGAREQAAVKVASAPAGKMVSEKPLRSGRKPGTTRLRPAGGKAQQRRVDIAMYAFTDKYLADQLD